jgi:hypothetical protein
MHLDLAAWLNLISTAAIVGALIFAGLQVRQGNTKRKDQAAVNLIQATQSESWTRAIELIGRLPENAQVSDVEQAGEEVQRALFDWGVCIEPFGYMVFRRNIDLQIVDQLIGGVTLVFWSRTKAWAGRERKRTGNPKLFEWCEWLANQIADRREKLGHEPAYLRYREWRE